MGLSPFKICSSCTPTSASAPAPNPNPDRFVIFGAEQIGNNVVAQIRYLDCTNFEGFKVCVYRGATCKEIHDVKKLDPHFSTHGLAPFARFTPTEEGLQAARELAKSI